MQVAVTGDSTAGVSVISNYITMQHNTRAYLTTTCTDPMTPSMYEEPLNLMGRSIAFNANLSAIGCACNAAVYLVSMPGYGPDQQPAPSSAGDYYCDANEVGGTWCPEIDIMEANNAAFQSTPHKCQAPTGNYYPSCDKSGCGVNSYKTSTTAFGPGLGYTINTLLPFGVATTFVNSSTNGTLVDIVTTLSQNGEYVTYHHNDAACGSGYIESLTPAVKAGMVVTMSLWGDTAATMSWLDEPPCSASTPCNTNGAATFYNFRVI